MIHLLTGGLLGVVSGLRHALEPDHLAAVSTLVTEQRFRGRGALLGAYWGLGHTLALLAVGGGLGALQLSMPARLADLFELGVAVMLVGLGTRALRLALQQGHRGPETLHRHGPLAHRHAGATPHVHVLTFTLALRPLCVGLLHGLAGSGALTALVLATLPSTAARVLYVALFGLGSILGMTLLSGAAGWPLVRLGSRPQMARTLAGLSGALSAGLGVLWALPLLGRLLGTS